MDVLWKLFVAFIIHRFINISTSSASSNVIRLDYRFSYAKMAVTVRSVHNILFYFLCLFFVCLVLKEKHVSHINFHNARYLFERGSEG